MTLFVRSNGWDDDTVALQLLSYLEGDALTRIRLVSALSDYYGSLGLSPGLADYRRQFEKTVRRDCEDLSIFAIEMETLAVKAFGDIHPSAWVRMIRDWFITGHRYCDLWRQLDSVPPATPIRDIVDRCRVWESHADADSRSCVKPALERTWSVYKVSELAVMPADRVVAAVDTPWVGLADLR